MDIYYILFNIYKSIYLILNFTDPKILIFKILSLDGIAKRHYAVKIIFYTL